MGEFRLKDGTGTGLFAKVNSFLRLVVEAVTTQVLTTDVLEGRAFVLVTPVITLTTANESFLMRWEHFEEVDSLLGTMFSLSNNDSTGGAGGYYELRFYAESTSLVGGTPFTPIALGLGSPKTIDGQFDFGAEGATAPGGILVATTIHKIGEFITVPFRALYRANGPIAVAVVPPAGNTNVDFTFSINLNKINDAKY